MANKAKKKSAVKKSTSKKLPPKAAKKPVPKKKVLAKKAKPAVKKAIAKKSAAVKKTTPAKKPAQKKAPPKKITAPAVAAPVKKKLKNIDYSKAITPLADRLVIRVVQAEKITAGGIIIPDSVTTVAGHLEGEVLAVGHGSKNKKGNIRPLDVKIGDVVLFSEFSGTKVEFESEELQIIKESDVMGIVQK